MCKGGIRYHSTWQQHPVQSTHISERAFCWRISLVFSSPAWHTNKRELAGTVTFDQIVCPYSCVLVHTKRRSAEEWSWILLQTSDAHSLPRLFNCIFRCQTTSCSSSSLKLYLLSNCIYRQPGTTAIEILQYNSSTWVSVFLPVRSKKQ